LTRKLRVFTAFLLSVGWLFAAPPQANAAEGLTAQVYNVLGQNGAPYIPQGASPVVNTNVSNINFQWGLGSVLGGPSEDVIVRFTGSIRSDSTQDISFLATADDGTKLYIDGVLVANDWVDKGGGGTTTDPISFTAGVPKTIELMYYENGGGANVFLNWDQSGSMEIIPASAFTSVAAPVVKTIGPPRNLTIISGETSTILNWEAPDTGNTQPERYAISFNCSGCNGWGIATGNVGGPNSLNTTITIDHSLLNGLMPAGTVWSFHIRSDNDTFSLYSANSNVVTGSTYVAPAPEPTPTPTPSPSQTATVTIPTPETITVTTPTPETETVTAPSETSTVTTPTPSETTTVTIPTGPTEAEIAATTAAQAAAQQAEAARIQAETAALIAAQAAAAQAEAERIAAEEAAREAARIKAEAEAQAEAERIEAEIEAARIQAEIEAKAEEDRIAAELKAAEEKAEAEAKAEADRIEAERIAEEERIAKEAEEEAERIAAEEEAIAEAKAKAEAEALAEEKRIAEEAEAKELEEEKAAEEEAQAKEEELNEIIEDAKDGKELTEEQKEVVVAALIETLAPGESISVAEVVAAGVELKDLPPDTPIEVRTSESGEVLIITAEVAANIELVTDPGALVEAIFTDPQAALAAIGSIGADMTDEERTEATEMVVATVVATGAALNAVGAATVTTGGSTGSSSGGSGGGGASGDSKGIRRRRP
jgi:multidrug efflux pump subunit AcrA (membrane-fusion protein)